jgi:hypothetical protein
MGFFRFRRLIAVFALSLHVVLVTACMPSPIGRADLLSFIEDGKTTREQAYLILGEPTATFEGERILCFRLGRDEGGDFVIGKDSGFRSVRTSLIMAFDEHGVLMKHSLVQVKAP